MKYLDSGCWGLHPATRLFLWVAAALAVPFLSGPVLHGLAAVAASSLLPPSAAAPRAMIRRTRYLFLALLLLLPWSTPGRYAVMMLGALSPTVEGLHAAALQFSRSWLVVVGLGWALSGLDRGQRMIAFLFFLYPLARLRLPVERLAVRLSLTLSGLDDSDPAAADWKTVWRQVLEERYAPRTLVLDLGRWSARDKWCAALAVVGVVCAVGFNAGI